MKLTESTYILIIKELQSVLDYAKSQKNTKKIKKYSDAIVEISSIGTY